MKYIEILRFKGKPVTTSVAYRKGKHIRAKEAIFIKNGSLVEGFDEVAIVSDQVADMLVEKDLVRVISKAKAEGRVINDWDEEERAEAMEAKRARWDLIARQQAVPTKEELEELKAYQNAQEMLNAPLAHIK